MQAGTEEGCFSLTPCQTTRVLQGANQQWQWADLLKHTSPESVTVTGPLELKAGGFPNALFLRAERSEAHCGDTAKCPQELCWAPPH
ncbi:hypothetical protein QQF64_029667 [Cirrhinus molitorella]|uniref:Uncharacterized protein n=1 Tax=Cirrhinus molitorella TaxID=172907 RepID=A0ABR3N1E8_9TELE